MPELWRNAGLENESLSGDDRELLEHCRAYLPLAKHAQYWIRRKELESVEQVVQRCPSWLRRMFDRSYHAPVSAKRSRPVVDQLERLAERGLLAPRSSFVAECSRHATGARPAAIETIGITTRNRTRELERALESYAANARQYGRPLQFVVVDDAGSENEEASNRSLAESRDDVHYLGRSERQGLAEAVARTSGVDRELVDFALFGDARAGVTTGAARNTLLLANAGRPYLLVDDDSLCRVAAAPDRSAGLAISGRDAPTEFWFYRDRDEMLREAEFEDVDFLGLHESLLGWEVGAKLEEPLDVDFELDRVLRTSSLRVRATMAGILGDSGVSSSAYLFVNEASQRRLTVSEEVYQAAVRNRQVLRAVRKTTVARAKSCMAGNLGLDAAELLPPFVPVQRNSDGLFARLLKASFPHSCLGYFPCAGMHDPVEVRAQTIEKVQRDLERVRFADLAAAAMEPGASLGEMGRRFQGAAAEPEESLRESILATAGRSAERFTRDRDRDLPRFYRKLRDRHREILRESMTKPGYLVPRDLLGAGLDEDQAREFTRDALGRFGGLLEAWPAIWEASSKLTAAASRG